MKTMQEIEQAISQLSPAERERVAKWILESVDGGYRVAEHAPAYRVPIHHRMSVAEYLESEADGDVRHEYIGGEIYAMSGASESHNTIAGNVFTTLRSRVKGGPCRVYMSDFKVRLEINREDIFYYPDVLVSCHPSGIERYYLRSPTLVVEVLSPTTAATDQREKFLNYRQAQTLDEYCLIAQSARQVTLFRRVDNWRAVTVTALDAVVEFGSVAQTLSVAEIYADVRW
jgi:Uma2 family endonuclease